ncbi:hypothetical protein [Solibacillus sp. FSL K6-1523]|uniref:hypothetical protein n=1 Tax=Solibacillus sp. FSL K6-1523 TaxID=2921471 RepID=UPI0030F9F800
MDIFKIGNDFDYFDLTFIDEKDVGLFSTFKGQKITLKWKEDIFAISKDNLQKNELLEFDSRCFGSTLIMKKKFENLFMKLLSNEIEMFPVRIKNIPEDFIYINVLKVIPAIDFNGLDPQQSLSMLRNKDIKFNLNEISNQILFRDVKINYYYSTQKFIDFIESNKIKGLSFEKVGVAI